MAGRKVFATNEILTAADVNDFLMDQSVMVFADAAARTTAIPTPTAGMYAHLLSDNTLYKYNGTDWVSVGAVASFTADRTIISNNSGDLVVSDVTATELLHLDGVTANIQTQLDAKQPFTQPVFTKTAAYTAVAGDANDLLYFTNSTAVTLTIPDLIAIGDRIDIIRDGAGTVTIAAGTGVTSWGGAGTAGTAVTFKMDQQHNGATVYKVAANTYRVIGKVIP